MSFAACRHRVAAQPLPDLRRDPGATVEHVDLQFLCGPTCIDGYLCRTGIGGVVEQTQKRLFERCIGGDARTRSITSEIDARCDGRALQRPALDELCHPVLEGDGLRCLRPRIACARCELRDD